jgi:hypothetical protein
MANIDPVTFFNGSLLVIFVYLAVLLALRALGK